MCDIEIRKRTGVGKDDFQKLSQVLRHEEICEVQKEKRMLTCYVISNPYCDRECWIISYLQRWRIDLN